MKVKCPLSQRYQTCSKVLSRKAVVEKFPSVKSVEDRSTTLFVAESVDPGKMLGVVVKAVAVGYVVIVRDKGDLADPFLLLFR